MSKRNRDEAKKKRRQKRLQHRQSRERSPNPFRDLARVLERHDVPLPTRWPGGTDPSLDRPDAVKYEMAEFATRKEPGKSKLKQLESHYRQGILGFLPQLDHWVIEEFLYHGVPGDAWSPVEAFLLHAGERFPPPAQEQLRRWKEAQIGIYEIGAVQDETVELREWDPFTGAASGPAVRAITLNMGGVNVYPPLRGQVTLTYVAPWAPAEGIVCAMGYGLTLAKKVAGPLVLYRALQHPEIVGRPLPWKANRATADEYWRRWRSRPWYRWFQDQLQFPFWAMAATPPLGKPELRLVKQLLPSTEEQAQQFGIYFEVPSDEGEVLASGATTISAVDVTLPNAMALAEYHAFRDRAGPPPGTPRSGPSFLTLK